MMEEQKAVEGFGAISQETRLRIVRMLVVAGADGMAAGVIGRTARRRHVLSPSRFTLGIWRRLVLCKAAAMGVPSSTA